MKTNILTAILTFTFLVNAGMHDAGRGKTGIGVSFTYSFDKLDAFGAAIARQKYVVTDTGGEEKTLLGEMLSLEPLKGMPGGQGEFLYKINPVFSASLGGGYFSNSWQGQMVSGGNTISFGGTVNQSIDTINLDYSLVPVFLMGYMVGRFESNIVYNFFLGTGIQLNFLELQYSSSGKNISKDFQALTDRSFSVSEFTPGMRFSAGMEFFMAKRFAVKVQGDYYFCKFQELNSGDGRIYEYQKELNGLKSKVLGPLKDTDDIEAAKPLMLDITSFSAGIGFNAYF